MIRTFRHLRRERTFVLTCAIFLLGCFLTISNFQNTNLNVTVIDSKDRIEATSEISSLKRLYGNPPKPKIFVTDFTTENDNAVTVKSSLVNDSISQIQNSSEMKREEWNEIVDPEVDFEIATIPEASLLPLPNEEVQEETADTEWEDLLKAAVSVLANVVNITKVMQGSWTYENAITSQREDIFSELFESKGSTFNLDDLLFENGGQPKRNLIFTTWRSGSTFLGQAITKHPAMFYHYEPLLHFDIVQVRGGELAKEGNRLIHNLLKCDYTDLEDYINYGKSHYNLHNHNTRLWEQCRRNLTLCHRADFLSAFCKLFPFQVMKSVRMRLSLAEAFLQDETLNPKVLYLVRDPRGVMESRDHRDWCPQHPDCSSPAILCKDMEDDYAAAEKLIEKYPDKLMLIRYEDMSLNPFSSVKKILQFFGLQYHPEIDEFIKTHTVKSLGGVSSTFRDSKSTPFRWIQQYLNKTDELQEIQDTCRNAMKLWGYAEINLKQANSNRNSFGISLLSPPWHDMEIPPDN